MLIQRKDFSYFLQCTIGRENGTPLQYSCLENPMDGEAWWAAVHGVAKSQTQLSDFTFAFHFHALEKEMATYSSVLALRIPGTGEPGGLPSMGSHRVGHDWSDLAAAATFEMYDYFPFSSSPFLFSCLFSLSLNLLPIRCSPLNMNNHFVCLLILHLLYCFSSLCLSFFFFLALILLWCRILVPQPGLES